jgi:hypothetical protein
MSQIVGNKYYCQDLLGIEGLQTARVLTVDADNNPVALVLSEATPGLKRVTMDCDHYLLLGVI